MTTLTIKATHVGPGFLQQIAMEFGIGVCGMDVTKAVPAFTFTGTVQDLAAMWHKYFLGSPTNYGELPCIP